MQRVTVDDAVERLSQLITAAVAGETILLIGEGQTEVQLVPVVPKNQPRKAGSAKGMVTIADDFDDPLPDFEDYMR